MIAVLRRDCSARPGPVSRLQAQWSMSIAQLSAGNTWDVCGQRLQSMLDRVGGRCWHRTSTVSSLVFRRDHVRRVWRLQDGQGKLNEPTRSV